MAAGILGIGQGLHAHELEPLRARRQEQRRRAGEPDRRDINRGPGPRHRLLMGSVDRHRDRTASAGDVGAGRHLVEEGTRGGRIRPLRRANGLRRGGHRPNGQIEPLAKQRELRPDLGLESRPGRDRIGSELTALHGPARHPDRDRQ